MDGTGDLTDEQWVRLEPLLLVGVKAGRPPVWTKRQLIDGIRWRTRIGSAMARCPGLLRGVADGVRVVPTLAAGRTWARMLTALQTDADARGL